MGVFDVAEDAAGADRGELLIITNQRDTCTASNGKLHGSVEGEGVGHASFVDDHQGPSARHRHALGDEQAVADVDWKSGRERLPRWLVSSAQASRDQDELYWAAPAAVHFAQLIALSARLISHQLRPADAERDSPRRRLPVRWCRRVPQVSTRLRGGFVSGWRQESLGRRMDRVKAPMKPGTPAVGWPSA